MQYFENPLTKNELLAIQKKYSNYCKVTADIVKRLIVVGPELHADGEKLLLEMGSQSDDVWGGGINLTKREIDATAVLNLRPNLQNPSLEILNPTRRERFINTVQHYFSILWD